MTDLTAGRPRRIDARADRRLRARPAGVERSPCSTSSRPSRATPIAGSASCAADRAAWPGSATSTPCSPRRRTPSDGARRGDPRRARRRARRLILDALDDRRDPLAHPDAHRGQAVAAAGPAQLVDQHRDQAAAAHPERMAERDRAAVDVDLGRVEAELVDADDRLRGERLVELDQVEVVDARSPPARAPCAWPGPARCP